MKESPPSVDATAPCEPERERLLQELARYYRYSATGQRITGIVHNFNTPLQVLSFQGELLERKGEEERRKLAPLLSDEARREWEGFAAYRRQKVNQLREEVSRLHQMVRQLLHTGINEGTQDSQTIDLGSLVRDELEQFQADRFFKHRVQKTFHLDQTLPPISGYYIDFSQSFRNLLDNALEAMAETPEPTLTVEVALEGGSRLIRIKDNGAGLTEEIKSRLFQPFVTTKGTPSAPRAGLGLYMTRRLLAPYHGEVTLGSQNGTTCATIILP